MSDLDDRVRKLIESGKLRPEEGREVMDAVRILEARSQGKEAPTGSLEFPRPSEKAFLAAQLALQELQSSPVDFTDPKALISAWFPWTTGLGFALLMIFNTGREPTTGWVIACILGGVLFGWLFTKIFRAIFPSIMIGVAASTGAMLSKHIDPLLAGEDPDWVPVCPKGFCPRCGKARQKVYKWSNPLWAIGRIHWFLNPALAICELKLGQRVAARPVQCLDCNSGYVECFSCSSSIDRKLMMGKRAFHNHRGLFCPRCSASIPCQRNLLALLLSFFRKKNAVDLGIENPRRAS